MDFFDEKKNIKILFKHQMEWMYRYQVHIVAYHLYLWNCITYIYLLTFTNNFEPVTKRLCIIFYPHAPHTGPHWVLVRNKAVPVPMTGNSMVLACRSRSLAPLMWNRPVELVFGRPLSTVDERTILTWNRRTQKKNLMKKPVKHSRRWNSVCSYLIISYEAWSSQLKQWPLVTIQVPVPLYFWEGT